MIVCCLSDDISITTNSSEAADGIKYRGYIIYIYLCVTIYKGRYAIDVTVDESMPAITNFAIIMNNDREKQAAEYIYISQYLIIMAYERSRNLTRNSGIHATQ